MEQKVAAWCQPGNPGHNIFYANNPPALRVCLLDGFLLYSPPKFDKIMSLIDIKLFLQVSRAKATQRREARDGYVTLEGFWKDPPGYVDKIVWPNYAEAHRWMFVDGKVDEGQLAWHVLEERGILAQKSTTQDEGVVDFDFEQTFEWVVDAVLTSLEAWHTKIYKST